MLKNNSPGLFIAFEGIDGAGSSTQLELLTKTLRKEGFGVLATKEPTNNVVGGLIKGVLTDSVKLPPDSLQLLFSADRAHHLEREIIPALKKGNVVLTDRYFFSTVAYGALDLDRNWLLDLNKNFLIPDFIFLLDVSAKVSIERIKNSRFEVELFEKEEKLAKVAKNFLALAKKFSKNTYVLNGQLSKKEVADQVVSLIKKSPKYRRLKK